MKTYNEMIAMTDAELNARVRQLDDILIGDCANPVWEIAYKERCKITAILDERYRERNQKEFDAFYNKHIKGRKWEEIDPEAWQCYSDWHKDMFGFRPKSI